MVDSLSSFSLLVIQDHCTHNVVMREHVLDPRSVPCYLRSLTPSNRCCCRVYVLNLRLDDKVMVNNSKSFCWRLNRRIHDWTPLWLFCHPAAADGLTGLGPLTAYAFRCRRTQHRIDASKNSYLMIIIPNPSTQGAKEPDMPAML